MQLTLALGDSKLPQIRDALRTAYGTQRDRRRHTINDQFVKAMLSSCTKDTVSGPAFLRLTNLVPTWELLPGIHPCMILRTVADITYAPDKVRHLLQCIHIVARERGAFDLSFLAGWPEDDAMSWLRRLPGVGPKVAAATLNFSDARKCVLAVDRHVLRLGTRLGLLPPRASFASGLRILTQLVPPDWSADDLYELHWLMKMHGQRVCRHTRPLCGDCVLTPGCPCVRSNSQQSIAPKSGNRLSVKATL
jgi:endonuclease-3